MLCGFLRSESDDDMMLPVQSAFSFCLEIKYETVAALILEMKGLESSWAGHGAQRLGKFDSDSELEILPRR